MIAAARAIKIEPIGNYFAFGGAAAVEGSLVLLLESICSRNFYWFLEGINK